MEVEYGRIGAGEDMLRGHLLFSYITSNARLRTRLALSRRNSISELGANYLLAHFQSIGLARKFCRFFKIFFVFFNCKNTTRFQWCMLRYCLHT